MVKAKYYFFIQKCSTFDPEKSALQLVIHGQRRFRGAIFFILIQSVNIYLSVIVLF